jgi:hypothetical protein
VGDEISRLHLAFLIFIEIEGIFVWVYDDKIYVVIFVIFYDFSVGIVHVPFGLSSRDKMLLYDNFCLNQISPLQFSCPSNTDDCCAID